MTLEDEAIWINSFPVSNNRQEQRTRLEAYNGYPKPRYGRQDMHRLDRVGIRTQTDLHPIAWHAGIPITHGATARTGALAQTNRKTLHQKSLNFG